MGLSTDYEVSMLRHELNEAINAAAEAEIGQYDDVALHKTLGEKLVAAMRAVHAMGTVPKGDVCSYTRRAIERRMHELQKTDGLAFSDRRMSSSLIYRLGKELGFTRGYGMTRAQMREAGEDPLTVAPKMPPAPRRARPDYAAVNARYIDALNSLSNGIRVAAEWLEHTAPFEDHVDLEHREMIVAMGKAFTRNIHDLASRQVMIPTNMQSMAVDIIVAALTMDKGLRQFFVAQKELTVLRARERGKKRLLNPKAMVELVHRAPKRLQPVLEFCGPSEAQWMHFHGQQCVRCKDWRMSALTGPDRLTCIACGTVAERLPTVFCPKCHYRVSGAERPPREGACPHCHEDIGLPQSMRRGAGED